MHALEAARRYRTLRLPTGISFTDNDYLGLSQHPRLREAGEWALSIGGAGSRGSRLLGGHSRWFEAAEADVCRYFGSPAAVLFSSGYLANLGVITALAPFVDEALSDEKNHASLIDGIRLSGLPKRIIPHNQWRSVQPAPSGRALLVAESLYSMDGDPVDAVSLRELWDRTGGWLVLDEAHAAGIFADSGRGLSEGWRDWSRMVVVVTFGKAFGVSGAAVLCSETVREWIVNSARSFIYSTAPPPVVPAMVSAAIGVLEQQGAELRAELWDRAVQVRGILAEIQPDLRAESVWEKRSPIVPLRIAGDDRALRFCENMRESGVEFRAIRYPTVAKGTERVRISLSLTVSRENTEGMAKEVVRQWKVFSS